MKVINLEDLSGLPREFITRLKEFNQDFTKTDYFDRLEHLDSLQDLIIEIDAYCRKNVIIGFHYTRANPESILKKGLIIRTGYEIRNEFLAEHKHLFSQEELEQILQAWRKCFDKQDEEIRDNRIFFNFTLSAMNDGGADLLLENYGGEQIYTPLQHLGGIKDRIKQIGKPIIVKCNLHPKDLHAFKVNPWGKIAVSSYHRMQNPNATIFDQDGYQLKSVLPENLEIIYL
jgi:hypothetical protein